MSIPLREGFANETLERCLEDLLVRFVVNCPEEDLSSIERVLFQMEEAHWFYQDYLRTLNPLLPSMKMKLFTNKLIEQCPLIWKWGDPSEALAKFGKYKSTIPVRGCALLNTSMDKMLLVKGIESSSWGFPRGKISKDESDVDCALRELDEETGFDASDLIDEDSYVERTIKGKNYKIYIVKGVPDDTKFVPKVRFEIADIQWMDIKYLTKAVKNSSNFYLVGSMFKPIVSYINRVKNSESEEELKRLATAQLKKILGLDVSKDEEKENKTLDPGRELLSMLQSTAKNPQLPSEINGQNNGINQAILQKQLQFQRNQHMLMQRQQFAHPFAPPNLLAFQQNRMVPMVGHNPFALQMFNPYLAFPHYGLPHGNMPMVLPQPMHNPLTSQGMELAPSASTFSKPQFSLPNKKPNENSKELLSILKSKPLVKKETKKSNSAELLSVLKKETKKQTCDDLPSTSSTLIRILKREKSAIEETKVNEIQSSTPKAIEPEEILDITKPANITTTRDINNVISNGKPIVLLKKSMSKPTNTNTPTTSDLSNNSMITETSANKPEVVENATLIQPTTKESIERKASTNERKQVSVNLLNLLTKPNSSSNNSDPSTQLLTLLKNPVVEKKEEPIVASDPSKDLLNLLRNPSPSIIPSTSSTANGKSSESWDRMGGLPKTSRSPGIDTSKDLLNLLKGNNPPSLLMPPGLTKEQSSSNDPSKDLLNLLKRTDTPTTSSPVIASTLNQSTPLNDHLLNSTNGGKSPISSIEPPTPVQPMVQPQSTSSVLLDILKRPSNNSSKQASPVPLVDTFSPMNNNTMLQSPLQQQQGQMGFTQPSNNYQPFNNGQYPAQDASSALLGVLKGSNPVNSLPNQQTQFQQFQASQVQQIQQVQQHQQIDDSSSILAMLKGNSTPTTNVTRIATPVSSQMQPTKNVDLANFQDFADFEDNDDDIEGEYIMNGGLYDS